MSRNATSSWRRAPWLRLTGRRRALPAVIAADSWRTAATAVVTAAAVRLTRVRYAQPAALALLSSIAAITIGGITVGGNRMAGRARLTPESRIEHPRPAASHARSAASHPGPGHRRRRHRQGREH